MEREVLVRAPLFLYAARLSCCDVSLFLRVDYG